MFSLCIHFSTKRALAQNTTFVNLTMRQRVGALVKIPIGRGNVLI